MGFYLMISSGGLSRTLELGGMALVSQTLPPTTEFLPMTVAPPRMVVPA
jgi:hypothetical protein